MRSSTSTKQALWCRWSGRLAGMPASFRRRIRGRCETGGPHAEKRTVERARRDRREGKRPTTQAGEVIREENQHAPSGEHGAPPKQTNALPLSKARPAGAKLRPPPAG